MNRDEIIQKVIQLLRDHKGGSNGYIGQEPYKGDFFRLFAAAFNAGMIEHSGEPSSLTTAAMRDTIIARHPDVLDSKEWQLFQTFWEEWTYAWQHCDQRE